MNKKDYLDSLGEEKVILDFWAEWCGPCKMVAPVLEELSAESGVKLVKVNVDEEQELAQSFGITSIPAIMVVEKGEIVKQVMGAKPKFALAKDLDF